MRFRTTVELGGKTATGLPVPAEVVEALGTGRRPPVRVTVAGHHYRSTVTPKLSYSRQLRHVLDVEGAKTGQTRQRRIAKVMVTLHEG